MNKEDEKMLDEMDKELQEKHETLKEGEWMCVLCEEIFKGTPTHFQNPDEPLCKDCYKVSRELPPNTMEVNGKIHIVSKK